jgi:predicted Ser/Thr protein kinase
MANRILSNRYELESELGRGGMGVVYRAQDTQVKRTVAIKTLPAIMTHNPDLMRRFQAEVQHASKLEHPNIVRVYDVGEDDGTHYYVMQYIEGSDLRAELKQRGRYTVEAALAVISQLAEALDYAHSQGIVHRDIKPENILLDKAGIPHIVDFGIAKAVEGTRMTRGLLGTPEYMSPEQVKGNRVDGRSDQYSLAVLAYELLTGRTPFPTQGDDPWAQINMHLNTPPPNPRTTVPDLPTPVANALLQALAKDPGQRFKDCGEFVRALRGKVKARKPRTGKKSRWIVPIAAAGFVLCLFLAGMIRSHRYKLIQHAIIKPSTIAPLRIASVDKSGAAPILYIQDIDGTARKMVAVLPFGKYYWGDNGQDIVYADKQGICVLSRAGGLIRHVPFASDIVPGSQIELLGCTADLTIALYAVKPAADESPTGLYLCNLEKNQNRKIPVSSFFSAELSPDGHCTAVYTDDGLLLFNENGKLQGRFRLGKRILLFHPTQAMFLLSENGEIVEYDYFGKEIRRSKVGDVIIHSCCANSDGKSFLAFSDRGAVLLGAKLEVKRVLLSWKDLTGYDLIGSEHDIRLMCALNGRHAFYTFGAHTGGHLENEVVGIIDISDAHSQRLDFEGVIKTNCVHPAGFHVKPYALEQWPRNSWEFMSNPLVSPDGKTGLLLIDIDEEGRHLFEVDLATGQLKMMQKFNGIAASSPSWVRDAGASNSTPNSITGKTATAPVVGLPQGFVLKGNQTADFDGDGTPESAYFALDASGQSIFMWMTKGGNIVWRHDELQTWARHLIQFDAYPITGGKGLNLAVAHSWSEGPNRVTRYSTQILRWEGGSFRNILPEIVSIGDTNYSLIDSIDNGGSQRSQVFCDVPGKCILLIEDYSGGTVAAEFLWNGTSLQLGRHSDYRESLTDDQAILAKFKATYP